MKRYSFMLCVLIGICMPLFAQQTNRDNRVQAIKIKELNARKALLQNQIAREDRKRNKIVNGVTVEAQERLNDRQDSICLELRSQLVAIELELNELVPDSTASVIANRLNQLNQNRQQ